jgi:dimethylhistidine N-methyltransferase
MLDFVTSAIREPDVAEAALDGLSRDRKTLPAKLFYDAEGCRLFGEITRLPEYYVTRTELALLREIAPQFGAIAPEGAALVEYGASREDKALLLLGAMRGPRAYVPIDVAAEALDEVAARMAGGAISVHPVAGDFLDALSLPEAVRPLPAVGFFPGSTIGNFDPDEAVAFLSRARATLVGANGNSGGALFLVGVDLRKDPAVLIPAYDDAAGVTAAFNRNLLTRLNREAAADFDLSRFMHEARWNDARSRIEMHLVSTSDQVVHVGGRAIRFARGETIHTENSYKHSVAGFQQTAARAGWRSREVWTDEARLFSLHLLQAGDAT